ncbi:hypothetical protein BU23DRAFT_598928 [Bimuria novae-zelandiae CBS 107.79]|uniref:Uncharacterized protein n=1 Tax=Bimuria novae-zelandiae CBS 107.79 TaxID=1447943 RepID=A0A6A5VJI2_9PLEO|nr:hypothetical protein BU23DRAFT_598928 [Bimuria novae-zelandiae CBS 107.79]
MLLEILAQVKLILVPLEALPAATLTHPLLRLIAMLRLPMRLPLRERVDNVPPLPLAHAHAAEDLAVRVLVLQVLVELGDVVVAGAVRVGALREGTMELGGVGRQRGNRWLIMLNWWLDVNGVWGKCG